MSSKWSYLAYSQDWTIISRCKHPCLLRAAAGAALGVQAATARRHLAYPLPETAGASCPTSPHTTSSDTSVHAALSLAPETIIQASFPTFQTP